MRSHSARSSRGGLLGRRAFHEARGTRTCRRLRCRMRRTGRASTRTRTGTVPLPSTPRARAAAYERSMIRPPTKGPRSFTRTSTERPLFRFVTRRRVPNGSVGWAAVSLSMSNVSPLAVGRPWWYAPYHEASPICRAPTLADGAGRSVAHPAARSSSASTGASRVALARRTTIALGRAHRDAHVGGDGSAPSVKRSQIHLGITLVT
jgi:hypothetical protein